MQYGVILDELSDADVRKLVSHLCPDLQAHWRTKGFRSRAVQGAMLVALQSQAVEANEGQ